MSKTIFNLTQHVATPEQIAAGVVEPDADLKKEIQRLLTFDVLPTREDIHHRAAALAYCVVEHGHTAAMIGGAGFFMGPLEDALSAVGVQPLHAFTTREATDVVQPDGSVKKTQVFRFAGFVPGSDA